MTRATVLRLPSKCSLSSRSKNLRNSILRCVLLLSRFVTIRKPLSTKLSRALPPRIISPPMLESQPITDWASSLDDQDFVKLMEAYRPMLHALAHSLWDPRLNGKCDTSDAIQETWTKIANGRPSSSFANRMQFASYLKTTLFSCIQDAKRRWIISKKRSVNLEADLSTTSLPPNSSHSKSSVLDQMSRDELSKLVFQAVVRLPDELQELLKWKFQNKESFIEIGERLERNPDAVRYLVRKCIDQIRSDLRFHHPNSFRDFSNITL
jgi:RNA polymerase sigma factor (sigma-70 family)